MMRAGFAALLLAGLAATGAPGVAAEAMPDDPGSELAAVGEALANAREQRFRQQWAEPAVEAGPFRFDLGLAATDAELAGLALAIDGEPLPAVVLAAEAGAALRQHGGLQPLAALALASGPHRLSVSWNLRGQPERRDEFAFEISTDDRAGDRELRLERRQPLAGLSWTLIEWRVGQPSRSAVARVAEALAGDTSRSVGYQPGSPNDPRWRRARQLLALDRPWPAALALARLEADGAGDAATAALLAVAASRCGLVASADAALRGAAKAARGLYAEALLAVAQRQLADGQVPAAMLRLDALPLKLAPALRNEAVLARASGYFLLGRADRATQTLQAAEFDPLRLIAAPVDERLRAGLVQYDLGLALIASGAVERGRALLDRLGRAETREPIEQALRDRANLSLASHFLRAGQGATARPIFERIPLEGPYSNLALLGLGWAALGPQGALQSAFSGGTDGGARETPKFVLKAMQRRRLIDCEDYNRRALAPTEMCRRLQPFAQAEVADGPASMISLAAEALLVWQELALREPRDPAVREAWVAVGRAAERTGQRRLAGELYDAAVLRLEAALRDNADAAASSTLLPADLEPLALEPGRRLPASTLAGFEIARRLDAATPSPALHRLLAEIAETRWLIDSATRTAGVDETLAALDDRQRALLPRLAAVALDGERHQLLAWLAAARAGVAAIADPALAVEPPEDPQAAPR